MTKTDQSTGPVLDIDIVSDVMCPWCIIGYQQLEQALATTGMGARIRWHPFELNPDMPLTGQNTSEHIQEKYGSTPEQSAQSRAQIQNLGVHIQLWPRKPDVEYLCYPSIAGFRLKPRQATSAENGVV